MHPLVSYIQHQLCNHHSPQEALQLSFWLAEYLTHLSRTQLIACHDNANLILPANIENMLQRINNGEPLPYITQHMEWMDLSLFINNDVLIPRIETADLVTWILQNNTTSMPQRVVEIGTGSGCIAIKLKKMHPEWHLTAVDISEKALIVAKKNAKSNGVEIDFVQQDIFAPLTSTLQKSFDILVSNPPYVRTDDIVDERVRQFEPHIALFVPQDDPLRFYRRMCELNIAPNAYFEINEKLSDDVVNLLKSNSYASIQTHKDLFGKPRMVYGKIVK